MDETATAALLRCGGNVGLNRFHKIVIVREKNLNT